MLLCTGWGQKRGHNEDYCNLWPYLTEDGANWLLEKGVKGVGIDAMSVGGPLPGEGGPPHKILLAKDIWLLEELYIRKNFLSMNVGIFSRSL